MSNDAIRQAVANSPAARRMAITALCLVGAGALILGIILPFVLEDNAFYVAMGVYVLASSLVPRRAVTFHPHARFGLANTLTLIRLMLACVLAGFAAQLSLGGANAPGAFKSEHCRQSSSVGRIVESAWVHDCFLADHT